MSFAVIGVFLLQSCSSDETYDVIGSTENKVYINTQSWNPINIPKNSFLFTVINTPIGSIIANTDKIEIKFVVQCTHTALSDINVKFEFDNSLISDGYATLPSGVALNMDKTDLTISKGASVSNDSITISIDSDDLDFLEVGTYMAPVKISSVTNAKLSDNLMSAYVIVETTFSNCIDMATSVSGTAADRTGWIATVDDVDQGSKLFDNNNSTYYLGGNFTLEVDLGTVHENITGLMMDFYAWYYAMGSANIYTSATTTNDYELQGKPTFSDSTPQYVNFYGPVDARFIKIEVTSPSYSDSYGTAIIEFNLYQQ